MHERYEPRTIEPKWQQRWEREGLFRLKGKGEKRYVLEMFPYPSGKMHMGHVRNYLIGDVLSRYYRMKGFDVLHPMGWDALGLPAENAAIKDQRHPAERTLENVGQFKAEMMSVGYSYDWDREINTSHPEYYRWNQWFFLKMRQMGLVYRRMSRVNWCPGCATVIANEQVKEGTCERSGDPVVVRKMQEWAFRITRYSEELLQDLDKLTEWPERITSMQKNWIGKSEGTSILFAIDGQAESLEVFTTRSDTLFGVTYVVVAPDHALMPKLVNAQTRAQVEAFAADMERKAAQQKKDEEPEKEGVFTGAYAVHPFTGQKVPVWAANFVVSDYGTGAVMSVPAHDQRDFEFARKYGLPIKPVIQPKDGPLAKAEELTAAFPDDGVMQASDEFTGLPSDEGRQKLAAALKAKGGGGPAVTYRQRDWGFSRQRYWGTPIPIVYCEKCDPAHEGIGVPVEQLPVKLPDIDVAKVLTGRGEPPLSKVPEWVNTTCPKCRGPARREVETMDTFVDSTWYFARYLSPHDETAPFDKAAAQRLLPVDVYVGGPEHAVMHLLYFRFWTKVMRDMGLVEIGEPVKRLVTQGIVNGPDGRKMSKRWGNVVSPSDIVGKFGADAARTFVLFAGPPEKDIDWSDEQVEGCSRFLARVWRLAYAHREAAAEKAPLGGETGNALAIRKAAHKALKRVTEDVERLGYNTAIARVMELVNYLTPMQPSADKAERAAMAEAVRLLAAMISPFAPHIAEEIDEAYGATESLQARTWPAFDAALAAEDAAVYAVQVMGKLRGQVQVGVEAGQEEVQAAAMKDEKVAPHLTGKTIKKVVFVPKRLINFVVA
ncbi:MAG: leucine--tRNA ligase [Deltaproteobacteria bacterium]|nr:leucine--tRNA ligase [Deltaproteobacteria bacterium]